LLLGRGKGPSQKSSRRTLGLIGSDLLRKRRVRKIIPKPALGSDNRRVGYQGFRIEERPVPEKKGEGGRVDRNRKRWGEEPSCSRWSWTNRKNCSPLSAEPRFGRDPGEGDVRGKEKNVGREQVAAFDATQLVSRRLRGDGEYEKERPHTVGERKIRGE